MKKRTFAAVVLVLCACYTLAAQQVQITIDPAQTKIQWTLGATLHTVHGTFQLKSGQISFDPSSGNAGGELVIEAASGDSGNSSRDNKMHKDVLETKRYPEITFLPKKVSGPWSDHGNSTLHVQGVFHIHGADHDLTLPVKVEAGGDSVKAATHFAVPYQAWGMKNPSSGLLHVDDQVQVSIAAVGKMTSASAAAGH